jgi:hypothetical protein
VWGVAGAVPTRQVVAGFEPVSVVNHRVILQEWLAEAFTMWWVAAVVIITTAVAGADAGVSAWIYRAAAGLLGAWRFSPV